MTLGPPPLGLSTFDVFDTALTRLVGSPKAVFILLGRQLVQQGHLDGQSSQQFAKQRIDAENRARMNSRAQEISLRDIYRELVNVCSFVESDIELLCRLEVRLEESLLRPVPEIQRLVQRERSAGRSIGFISDTYLPAENLTEWLTRADLLKSSDVLWASSKEQCTKATGDLFRRAAASYRIDPRSWRHLGDHPRSDVSVPAAMGIDASLFPDCHLNRYEEMMESYSDSTEGLASLMAGAARWARLSVTADSPSRSHVRDIAADVGAPVLFSFLTWVLRKAKDEGLKRLWFVSRDGQIMLEAARPIAAKLGIDIELGYLYGGRQVVNLAGLESVDAVALEWILGGAFKVSIVDVLDRVGLCVDDLSEALVRHQIPLTGKIPWEKVASLRECFREPEVAEKILKRAETRRVQMREYFSSCGLTGGDRCGIVDIGWRGRVFKAIGKIIGAEHAAKHAGLYFGLFGRPEEPPPGRMHAFMFDRSQDPALGVGHDIPCLTELMEILCQADHGPVLGVERRGEAFEPILRAGTNSCGPTWDIPLFQQTVKTFAETIDLSAVRDLNVDLRGLCDSLLRTLLTQPTRVEAATLGGVDFADDQTGSMSETLAAPYRLSDCWAAFVGGEWPRKSFNWWTIGAQELTHPVVRASIGVARRLHRGRELFLWRALRSLVRPRG